MNLNQVTKTSHSSSLFSSVPQTTTEENTCLPQTPRLAILTTRPSLQSSPPLLGGSPAFASILGISVPTQGSSRQRRGPHGLLQREAPGRWGFKPAGASWPLRTVCICNHGNPSLCASLALTVFTWFHLPETFQGAPGPASWGEIPQGTVNFCGYGPLSIEARPPGSNPCSVTGSVLSGKSFNLCLRFPGL